MNVKIIGAVVLLGVLPGCDSDQSGSTDASQVNLTVNSAESASKVTAEPKAKQPLDLTLTADVIPSATITEESEKLPLRVEGKLPNMFADDADNNAVSVGGGVIREEDNPDIVDSVQGAEVSIEFKTD